MVNRKSLNAIIISALAFVVVFFIHSSSASAATIPATLTSPAANSTQSLVQISFTLPEDANAATVGIQFQGASTYVLYPNNISAAGTYSFTLNPVTGACVPSSDCIVFSPSGPMPNGLYDVTFFYQDSSLDPTATTTNDNVNIDTTDPPTISNLSPSNNQTNVATNSPLVLTFNESVAAGSGNLYIKKASDNSVVQTIPVTSSQVTGSETDEITITPSSTLSSGTAYYVSMDPTAFENLIGIDFPGISSSSTWAFTTIATATSSSDNSVKSPDTGFGRPNTKSSWMLFLTFCSISLTLISFRLLLAKLAYSEAGK